MSDNEDYLSDYNSDNDSFTENKIKQNKKGNISNYEDSESSDDELEIKKNDDEDENIDEDEDKNEKKNINLGDEDFDDDDDENDDENVEDDDDENDEDDDEDEDLEEDKDLNEDEEEIIINKKSKKSKIQKGKNNSINYQYDESDQDSDDENENYLQKFDSEINKSYIFENHPECLINNYDEINKLCKVVRDSNNIIIDSLHKTCPFLTKYEKAKILGQRTKQLENNSTPFVKVPENIIDSYIIAELELQEKRIPFIIRRPIPGGAFEYWHLKDLEIISF